MAPGHRHGARARGMRPRRRGRRSGGPGVRGSTASQASEVDTSSGQRRDRRLGDGRRGRGARASRRRPSWRRFPDVTVNVTPVPWDAAHDRIVNAIAGGEVPDVTMVGTTWMGEFAALGGLDPTPANIDGSQFFEGAWNTTVVDGISYAVPWYVETRLLYYRTDLAEEGGVTEPRDLGRPQGAGRGHAGGRRGVRHQPSAGRNRLVADVHAVLLAGGRRDHRRGRRRSRSTAKPASRRSPSTTRSSRRA